MWKETVMTWLRFIYRRLSGERWRNRKQEILFFHVISTVRFDNNSKFQKKAKNAVDYQVYIAHLLVF
jgi:hypothetical protein